MKRGISTWRTMKLQRLSQSSGWKRNICKSWHNYPERSIRRPRRSLIGPNSSWIWEPKKKSFSRSVNMKMQKCAESRLIKWRHMRDSLTKTLLKESWLSKKGPWESDSSWHLPHCSREFKGIERSSWSIDLRMLRDLWKEMQTSSKICWKSRIRSRERQESSFDMHLARGRSRQMVRYFKTWRWRFTNRRKIHWCLAFRKNTLAAIPSFSLNTEQTVAKHLIIVYWWEEPRTQEEYFRKIPLQ